MAATKILFMPITWAVGFLLPFFAQAILALDLTQSMATAYLAGAVIAVPWGAMAQFRGSWVWVK